MRIKGEEFKQLYKKPVLSAYGHMNAITQGMGTGTDDGDNSGGDYS
jgi:hypothetical protein